MNFKLLHLLPICLLGLSFVSGLNVSHRQQTKKLKGKWIRTVGGEYVQNLKSPGAYPRWYEFQGNKRISFSSCTDMCGCIRRTDYGKYHWENDSVIAVTFTHFSKRSKHKMRMEEPKEELIQILFKGKNRIHINSSI